MSDREDNTTNERPGTSTDSGAQNMPSANVFADMFKAALAPVLSQLTTLNKNVSAVLLNEHEDSEEDGEAASNDRPAMSADMDADLWWHLRVPVWRFVKAREGNHRGQ